MSKDVGLGVCPRGSVLTGMLPVWPPLRAFYPEEFVLSLQPLAGPWSHATSAASSRGVLQSSTMCLSTPRRHFTATLFPLTVTRAAWWPSTANPCSPRSAPSWMWNTEGPKFDSSTGSPKCTWLIPREVARYAGQAGMLQFSADMYWVCRWQFCGSWGHKWTQACPHAAYSRAYSRRVFYWLHEERTRIYQAFLLCVCVCVCVCVCGLDWRVCEEMVHVSCAHPNSCSGDRSVCSVRVMRKWEQVYFWVCGEVGRPVTSLFPGLCGRPVVPGVHVWWHDADKDVALQHPAAPRAHPPKHPCHACEL